MNVGRVICLFYSWCLELHPCAIQWAFFSQPRSTHISTILLCYCQTKNDHTDKDSNRMNAVAQLKFNYIESDCHYVRAHFYCIEPPIEMQMAHNYTIDSSVLHIQARKNTHIRANARHRRDLANNKRNIKINCARNDCSLLIYFFVVFFGPFPTISVPVA